MAKITIPKYNSNTGEGTLSYYARQYNTTVDKLAKTNNISDPNLIQEGGSLTVPDNGPIQTTSSLRKETNKNMAQFDEKQAMLNANNATTPATDTNTPAPAPAPAQNDTPDPYAGLDKETKVIQQQAEEQVSSIQTNLDRIQRLADSSYRELINATRQIYSARLDKMRNTNKRLLATKDTLNTRSGRTRYTAELADGILTDEELSGNERLSEIEGQMLSAIAEANTAKQKGDMQRFNASFDRIKQVQDRMDKQVKENYNNAIKQDKAIRETEKANRQAKKDEFKQMLDRADAAAPALVSKLESFSSVEDQTAFLEAYSKQSGVDMDVLLGSITTATNNDKEKSLKLQNIQNQITNRNTTTSIAQQREARLSKDKNSNASETENVMSGITRLDDIENVKTQEKVKSELQQYGFFDDNPPDWFVAQYNKEQSFNFSVDIKGAWNEYRKVRGIIN